MREYTDEENILFIRMLIGDTEGSPFYPLFPDTYYRMTLDRLGGDLRSAAMSMAISASFQLTGWNTRERTGSIEVWNNMGENYLKALQFFVDNEGKRIPSGINPWAAGFDIREECAVRNNPYFPKSHKLTSIYTCDDEDPCKKCVGVCLC